MGENSIKNIFQLALAKSELEDFVLGKEDYFVMDPEYGNHWPLGSYKIFLENGLDGSLLPENFWSQLKKIMASSNDINAFLDSLIGYLLPYYNSADSSVRELRKKMTPEYIVKGIKHSIYSNKRSLEKDIRGTGAIWNSQNGMLGGIVNNLKIIKQRGGPDFIPEELKHL